MPRAENVEGRLLALEQRVANLECALTSGMVTAADEPIVGIRAIAKEIGLRSPKTLRTWAATLDLAQRHKLSLLLKKNPSGRYFTSRRLVAQWRQAIATNPWELPR